MSEDSARNRDIIRRRAAGQTYRRISEVYNISAERVRQIVMRQRPPRPRTSFRFNTGKRVFMQWVAQSPHWSTRGPPTEAEVAYYVLPCHVSECVEAGLVVWNGEEYEATQLGRDLLKWRVS